MTIDWSAFAKLCIAALPTRCKKDIRLVKGSAKFGVIDHGAGDPVKAMVSNRLVIVLKYMTGARSTAANPRAQSGKILSMITTSNFRKSRAFVS